MSFQKIKTVNKVSKTVKNGNNCKVKDRMMSDRNYQYLNIYSTFYFLAECLLSIFRFI